VVTNLHAMSAQIEMPPMTTHHIGAILGWLIFGFSFSVFAIIGVILLVGLAIKNGILLVDRTNLNRQRGLARLPALLEAGPAQLRPILMTSTTIAVALLPTAAIWRSRMSER
jgi:HAE1 family hydrophobic/amphiphilic exporter-1